MSYELDEDGNKVFYDPDLEKEKFLRSFRVEFKGVVYVDAYDVEHAENILFDRDDIQDYIDDVDVAEE